MQTAGISAGAVSAIIRITATTPLVGRLPLLPASTFDSERLRAKEKPAKAAGQRLGGRGDILRIANLHNVTAWSPDYVRWRTLRGSWAARELCER